MSKLGFMALKSLVIGVCLLSVTAADIGAFDGKRKGFVLGLGVGTGVVNIERTGGSPASVGLQGICTDLTVGWGVSNRVVIHCAGRQQFFFDEDGSYFGFPGLGVSYFHRQEAPSMMYMAGIAAMVGRGIESVGTGSEGSVGGVGPYVGIGYQWSKHFVVEFALSGSIDAWKNERESTHKISWFSLSVNYLGH